ncbi:hypothetical protein [Olivibacter sp. CPCC 100613]|uniref:hypothetical protein n=1 Tax=Olivibacter sp. CPCC 100613 TaxID=3079931 RepID=UPI002FF78F82
MFFSIDFSRLKKSFSRSEARILVTSGDFNGRKDYYEIISHFRKNNEETAFYDMVAPSYRLSVSLFLIVRVLVAVVFNKQLLLSLRQRIQLACMLSFRLNCARALERIDLSKFEKYVAFSSVHPEEATFTRYFQKRGIPTYSLQHGIYHIFKEDKPMDVISYENFNTDHHFCWGAYTRDEFMAYGIPANRLLVGGYPRHVKRFNHKKEVGGAERLLVMLARVQFAESNDSLILLIRDFAKQKPNLTIDFKLHPSLDARVVKKALGGIKGEVIDPEVTVTQMLSSGNYGAAIANNTSAYYESYMYHTPCLRYVHSSFTNSIGVLDDEFDGLSALISKYAMIKEQADYAKIEERLRYICGFGENNYNLQP